MATDTSPSMPASPPRAKLGYSEYCCFPDDGRRHEIIDGDHYMTPAPSTAHQTVSKRLQHQLYTQIELAGLGLVFNAPVDVQLTDHDIVQPDLVVVLAARTRMITPTKINGVPDLIVEILSPSTAANDTSLKKQLYARTGVGEYWIADPDNQRLEQYRLVDGGYRLEPATDPVAAFSGSLRVRLADVW
ncbi:MAG: Uma2 family endonuclease [Planctomycetia bacterium]|jgi:Uma2 family endonuclease